ncbi:Integrase core domain-containing protein, partial [Balnearium lithotrophicum]
RSPKTNAHVERFIQTVEKELWMIEGTEPTVDEMNRKLFRYLSFYNFVRPHQGLGYKTPVEKFEEYIKKLQGVHHVLNENKALTIKELNSIFVLRY